MRIGKPSKAEDYLEFKDIKVGETFRPWECWTEEGEKKIFIKMREIKDEQSVFGVRRYNALNLRDGELYSFVDEIRVDYVDSYIAEVK